MGKFVIEKIKKLEDKRDSINKKIDILRERYNQCEISKARENINKLIGKYFIRKTVSDIILFKFCDIEIKTSITKIRGIKYTKSIDNEGFLVYCCVYPNYVLMSFAENYTMDYILNYFHERYTEISKEEFNKYVKEMSNIFLKFYIKGN